MKNKAISLKYKVRNNLLLLLLGTSLLLPGLGQAAEENKTTAKTDGHPVSMEETVVTASRVEESLRMAADSVTVITEKEIQRKKRQTVVEVLNDVPGVFIPQNGANGGSSYVYMRGTNNAHTVILIDGVRVGDPISTDGKLSISNMPTDNIERIEVVRGNQSVLYGSDAIGGVINIITKKGKGKPTVAVGFEGGSYQTFKENVAVSGATDRFDFSASVTRFDTQGVSKADVQPNPEMDYYNNTNISAKLNGRITDKTRVGFSVYQNNTKMDYDNTGADAYKVQLTDMTTFSANIEQDFTKWWTSILKLGNTDVKRDYFKDGPGIYTGTTQVFESRYTGSIKTASWQNNFFLGDKDTLTVGLDYMHETGAQQYGQSFMNDVMARTQSAFVQNKWTPIANANITVGIRSDNHQQFGQETTYKVAGAYLFERLGTKIRASYGTGFHAPSLYQLYDPTYGNTSLVPEKSQGYDAGIDQSLFGDKVALSATYFRNNLDNLIVYDFTTSKYANVQQAQTSGVETTATWRALRWLSLSANYTYLEAKNDSTQKQLTYRPHHTAGGSVNILPLHKLNWNISMQYVGERYRDTNNTASMPAYMVCSTALSYDVTKWLQVTGRISNFTNKYYNSIYQYGEPGIGFYGGMKLTF
ncbi:MAG: TonB-dependent receptor plug domain-containing protein [Smithellaceae bacterium]